jgi:AcrR family transcriptional regulator
MVTSSRKRVAKRKTLTRESVLDAALKLADAQGLEALSMRNLAQALKVEAMSLYNHVSGKEDILDGLVELVVAELALPAPGGDWRAAMRERAHSAHEVLMSHPWATMLFVSRMNVGPNMLRYVDATIGCLRAAGFSYAMADHAWNALDAYVYGFTLQRLNFPLEPKEYASSAQQFLPMIPRETHPHLRGMAEEVIEGRHDGVQHLPLGLELLLTGLEQLRATQD